jgi:hypothetical protein
MIERSGFVPLTNGSGSRRPKNIGTYLNPQHCWKLRVKDCVQYARYLRLHLHNTEKAREVVSKALEANPKNVKLYLQMLGETFCTFFLLKFHLFFCIFL